MDTALNHRYIPTSDAASYYLRSLTLTKQYEKAELFWTIDTGRYGVQFNTHFYNSVFFLYCYQYNWYMSNSVLQLMKEMDVPTEDWTLTSSFKTHLMLGHQKEASELWMEIKNQKIMVQEYEMIMNRLSEFVIHNLMNTKIAKEILNDSIKQLLKTDSFTKDHLQLICQYYSKLLEEKEMDNVLTVTRMILEKNSEFWNDSMMKMIIHYLLQKKQYDMIHVFCHFFFLISIEVIVDSTAVSIILYRYIMFLLFESFCVQKDDD